MNEELRRMISSLDDAGVMRLAVAVQQQLDDEASNAAFARLNAEQAAAFLANVDRLHLQQARASDKAALAGVARKFLDLLLRTEAFDDIVAAAALDTGVRVGLNDIVGWFQRSFNLASLVGIQFEYVSEKRVVQRTEAGSIETSRTVRIGVGSKGD